jgi:hypothetical protein
MFDEQEIVSSNSSFFNSELFVRHPAIWDEGHRRPAKALWGKHLIYVLEGTEILGKVIAL